MVDSAGGAISLSERHVSKKSELNMNTQNKNYQKFIVTNSIAKNAM